MFEVGEARLIGQDLVHKDMEKVKVIKEGESTEMRKPNINVRTSSLKFKVGWLGVFECFTHKGGS